MHGKDWVSQLVQLKPLMIEICCVFLFCAGMELQRVDNPNQSLDYVNSAVESTRQSRISLPTNEIMSIKGIL